MPLHACATHWHVSGASTGQTAKAMQMEKASKQVFRLAGDPCRLPNVHG
jgi:hypothetical protein